jgi:hypothetical protein
VSEQPGVLVVGCAVTPDGWREQNSVASHVGINVVLGTRLEEYIPNAS